MKVTLKDIAQETGVSVMAVSAVLNGSGKNVAVRPEKADEIRNVARRLRYQPNHLARSLRGSRTGMVAVVFQHFSRLGHDHPYHSLVLNGVISALFPKGYTIALCPKLNAEGNAAAISDGRFDGVLWCRPDLSDASIEALQMTSVPVVVMHAPPGTIPGVSAYCADNDAAMRRVVSHLTELGHTKLAFAIDRITSTSVEGKVRLQAFESAVRTAGLPEPAIIIIDDFDDTIRGFKAVGFPFTAMMCFSDELAGYLLEACSRAGISVPNDISIVGFDSSSFCEATQPRLTSVRQPVEHMAHAATTHLLSLIDLTMAGETVPPASSVIYDCELDIRESTARPTSQ